MGLQQGIVGQSQRHAQARPLSGLLHSIADVIWPPTSLLSDARVDQAGVIESELWCSLVFLGASVCDCCGVPMEDAIVGLSLCPACLADPPGVDHARAALAYDDLSRPLVLSLKHANRQDGLGVFAGWMGAAMSRLSGVEQAIIVPVPSHWTRLAMRGYNQAARLAGALSVQTNCPWHPDLLIKSRRTESQKGKSATGRDRNVRGSFAVHSRHAAMVEGATILLVDDVFTTGATLNACARVLKRAGAHRVLAVTLARVIKPIGIDLPSTATGNGLTVDAV
jgi:ComF family protein